MNNKSTKKEPLVQRRGFFIALYGCLGALLILAAVISYNNYTAVTKARELAAQKLASEELMEANASTVQSYLTPEDRGQATTPKAISTGSSVTPRTTTGAGAATPNEGTTPRATPSTGVTTPRTSQTPEASPEPDADKTQASPSQQPASAPKPASTPAVTPKPAVTDNQTTPAEAPKPDGQTTPETTPVKPEATSLSEATFEEFAEGGKMSWPVLGEIVMDYSSDRLIYDKTLEQFRTNDVLCIATDAGTPVHAAAGGIVVAVENTTENGNSVTLDHGNGWTTTYSQLQDGVLVKPGDVVNQGQVIGGVGKPSIYGVLLGYHLQFAVAQDGSSMDPKTILE